MQWRWKTVNSTPQSKARTGRNHARIARRRWIPVVEGFEDRTLLSLSVGTSFTGGVFSQSGFIPPDTQGAAGPTQLVETLNGEYSVFSKTGSLVSQTDLDSFFNTALAAGGGGTVTGFSFDPRIAYDEQSQRFFVAGDDNAQQANSFIIAVSNSSDATAGWKAWKVAADPTGKRWMDFPTLGLNHDGVYLGGNMFPISGSGVNTELTDILVIPKTDLTSGVGVTNATLFANLDPNTTGFTPRPVFDLNTSEGQPETIISDFNTPAGVAKISLITGTVTAPVLNTSPSEGDLGGGFFSVPARNGPDPAPQLGDSHTLETGDTRFSSHVIEQGTNIWAVQGVDIGGRASIAWYRIDAGTGSVVENGTIADSSLSFYYPSISVNESGVIVIGFSGSSTSTFVGDYAVTGTFDGTTTTLGSPQIIQSGSGPYFIDFGTGRNRWGDYSEVVLDPNDHQTFWSVQEWANTVGGVSNSSWATQFTAFGVQQTVTNVSSTTPNGTYGVGATISINVDFSNPVVVTGTPQLALNSGGTASYSSGSGTSTLTFTYTVAAGQNANPLDEVSTSALTLNGGTINDVNSGVPALLTVPAPGTTGSLGVNNTIIIVTSAPTVTGVSSTTANGSYGVGSVIAVTVGFSNSVVVTGTPQLALNSGGTASYTSGSGTSTLTFTYTVAAGQNANPLDEASTSALTLSGGTINDATSGTPAVLTLPAPGTAGSLGANKSIVIDTRAPTVTGVSSTTANGSYGVGSTIAITIGWSKTVVVTGTPRLALNSGGTASFSSGSGTTTLTFTYTVAAGQNANPLDEASATALTLNGGTIFDTVGTNPNAANLTLPAPGTAGSLGANKSIVIDTTAPTVTGVSSTTANGSYGVGSTIAITIGWSKTVVVTGTPQLALNSGGTASYSSGSGTTTLTFTYTVAAGQNANPLDEASATALTLNGGTIFDTVGTNPNAANLTLPAPGTAGSLGANKSIVIDTTAPTVTGVSSTTANGSYGVGSTIAITIGWSKVVVVTGTPQLALNSGGTASFSSGSGTTTLTFTYTVAAGQNANPLDEASATALTLNGGTIFDTVGTNPNAANLTLPAPGTTGSLGANKTIVIDTTAPTVTGVSSTTANGSYGVGSTIAITIGWSKTVVVTGTPRLALNSGGTASFSSGSGTTTLTFTYTVAAGQNANPLDEASATALTLNGGTIFDTVGTNPNAANLTLPAPGTTGSLGANKTIVIDTTAPTVIAVTSTTPDGTYGVGATITITMAWSKAVVVTGTPQLALNSGGTANYSSGSGTSTLTFIYVVAAGENSPKLDYTSTTALSLNGGTIFDTVTNPNAANLTLPAPGSAGSIGGTKSIVIDTTATSVTGVSSTTASGSYGVGSSISIIVTFNQAVDVTGTPQLALNSGGTANYSSGSGTTTLTFTYIVAAGQNANPLDEASTSALTLNGGTINNASTGAAALLTLPAPGSSNSLSQSNIVIDTTAPTVTAVTSTTADGAYGVGSVITITMAWSKVVVVTGTPQLALNSGGTASYSSGSGTTTLTFTYTVAAGENSPKLDYTSTSALSLNGGTIFDTVGTNPNAANLTLPAPGSAGSIGGTKSIVIDTTAPTVTAVTSTTPDGTYGVGATITITMAWSKVVVVTGTPQLALNSGGTANYSSGSGTSTLTFIYVVAAGENSPKLDYTSTTALSLNGGTIFDTVTNPNAANLTLPAPGSAGSIGGTKSIVIDTTATSVTGVSSTTASGSYGVGSSISIIVTFNQAVDVTGTPQLALNSGGTANYSSGSGVGSPGTELEFAL